jgi:hypothetical protein
MRASAIVLFLSGGLLVACGEVAGGALGSSAASVDLVDSSDTVAFGGAPPAGPTSSVGCPADEPPVGAPCAIAAGLHCSYGSAPRANERHLLECDARGTWQVSDRCSPKSNQIDVACPVLPPVPDSVCAPATLSPGGWLCTYGAQLGCICAVCAKGKFCQFDGPLVWHCAPNHPVEGCPEALPNFGAPCPTPGQICAYADACAPAARCVGGSWCW